MTAALDVTACPKCGQVAYPTLNLNVAGQIVPSCPACEYEHPQDNPEPKLAKVLPIRDSRMSPPQQTTQSVQDPVELIRSRVAYLDEELAKCASYATERRQLLRMLKAAGRK